MADVAENSSTTVGEVAQNTQTQNVDNGSQTTRVTTPLDSSPAQAEAPAPVTYDFTGSVPEGFAFNQEASDKFVEVIKDMGLSNDQANAIAKHGFGMMKEMSDQIQAAIPQQMQAKADSWAAETKQAYGSNYDKAMANAGQAIEYLKRNGVPEIQNLLELTGAGSRVEMFQLLNVVSNLIESDPGKVVQGSPSGNSALDKFYNKSDFNKI